MSSALRSAVPFSPSTTHLTGLTRRLRSLPSLHVGAAALTVLVTGLLLAIVTTSDPLWWQLHFSQLGIFGDLSSAFFNTTLKVSGLIVVVFAFCVRRDVRRLGRGPVRRGAATVAFICLNVVGVNLALVGCIPLNTDKDLHDRVAGSMVLGFLALLISAPIMFNRLGKRMALSTAIATAWLIISIALFVSATINLALFETISCTAMFAWSGMFTHVLAGAASRTAAPAPAGSPRSSAHVAPRRARRRSLASSSTIAATTIAGSPAPRTRAPRVSGPGRTARRIAALALLADRAALPLSPLGAARRSTASPVASLPDARRSTAAAQAHGLLEASTLISADAPTSPRTNTHHDAAMTATPRPARGSAASAACPDSIGHATGCGPRHGRAAAMPDAGSRAVSASRAARVGSTGARRPQSRPTMRTQPRHARHAAPGAVRSLLR